MTGDDERDRIAADRGADGARGRRLADLAGDVGIGGRAADRHGEQRLPHPHLEIRADHHDAERGVGPPQRRIERAARVGRGRRFCPRPIPRAASAAPCRRAPPRVRRRRRSRGRPDRAARRRRSPRRTARGGSRSEDEVVAPIVAGRQRLVGDEEVVQPARAGEADVIGRVEHGRRIAQKFARALDGDRLQERLRRQPGPALEDDAGSARPKGRHARRSPRSRAGRASGSR